MSAVFIFSMLIIVLLETTVSLTLLLTDELLLPTVEELCGRHRSSPKLLFDDC